ncbi:hypothetical protein C2G38_2232164 [Gigaspora rosea]|uniref:Uncharacterized protein n=1 Tax=Gigaspora rosea TaxID=44941 RepID=A0A397TX74_9GLOM|nr:hypothetical protein C2G38_2232164 [Gigaspora rosea]
MSQISTKLLECFSKDFAQLLETEYEYNVIVKILNKEMLTSDDDNETKRQLLEIDNTLQEICTDENFTRWGSVLRDLQEKPETGILRNNLYSTKPNSSKDRYNQKCFYATSFNTQHVLPGKFYGSQWKTAYCNEETENMKKRLDGLDY